MRLANYSNEILIKKVIQLEGRNSVFKLDAIKLWLMPSKQLKRNYKIAALTDRRESPGAKLERLNRVGH
ncbi:hypothetical protein WN55_10656 [Dufourea novaeangliae]|uniref:Uncharacterized protein n=1 Tax=Dufourea novaeangliae TaxID=178035 RepID=A0A154P9F3_DUFNO|nr:hypothetical protein WN55_10656 [Dufourea novaeangliae]